jgi:hypothetical protein
MDGPISKLFLFHAQFGYETETKPWKIYFFKLQKNKIKRSQHKITKPKKHKTTKIDIKKTIIFQKQ